jgi:5-methylcytosine-specific restriction protein A
MSLSPNKEYRIEIDESLSQLASSLEVNLNRVWSNRNESMDFSIRVQSLPRPYGFELAVIENFLNWEIKLNLDDFANGMIENFQKNFELAPEVFTQYAKLAEEKSKSFTLEINNESIFSSLPPMKWSTFEFKLIRTFMSLDEAPKVLDSTLLDVFSILLPLSGQVTLEENVFDTDSLPEGDFKEEGQKITLACTKYERSRFNRRLCLNHYGYRCVACGILLAEKYGDAGRDLIHVHHLTPVSLMDEPAILNPIKDLVPLCPNCHNVAHRRNPPYGLEELRSFLGIES